MLFQCSQKWKEELLLCIRVKVCIRMRYFSLSTIVQFGGIRALRPTVQSLLFLFHRGKSNQLQESFWYKKSFTLAFDENWPKELHVYTIF